MIEQPEPEQKPHGIRHLLAFVAGGWFLVLLVHGFDMSAVRSTYEDVMIPVMISQWHLFVGAIIFVIVVMVFGEDKQK